MRNEQLLEIRKSYRYVTEYAYMDDFERIGRFSVLSYRVVDEGNGIDDLGSRIVRVRVDSGSNDDDIRRALSDAFSTTGCSHEYDCCGCQIRNAYEHQIKRDKRKEWLVPMSVGRNY